MGLVYDATLSPTKQELVSGWLSSPAVAPRAWAGGVEIATKIGEYRFDDPAGEVGIETILFASADGRLVQVPLTYRAEPLPGAEDHLVGTSEHSVLGQRWVYDGCGDPAWAAALASAILSGGTQAQMYLEQDDARIDVPPRIQVRGSGVPGADVPTITAIDSVTDHGTTTIVRCGDLELVLARVIGTPVPTEDSLAGSWTGGEGALAGLRRTT